MLRDEKLKIILDTLMALIIELRSTGVLETEEFDQIVDAWCEDNDGE